jgi:hypothetical protein
MRIQDRVQVKGRGSVLAGVVDVDVPTAGLRLRRSDGVVCKVRGVERFGKLLGLPRLQVGERVGLLVDDACALAIDDEVSLEIDGMSDEQLAHLRAVVDNKCFCQECGCDCDVLAALLAEYDRLVSPHKSVEQEKP